MLIVYVKHFLNHDGRQIFESWFNDCYDYISKQNGFISLDRAYDNTETEVIHIWLRIENREKMLAWGETTEHAQLIARLDPYRTKDWEAIWFDTEKPCVEKFTIPLGKHNVVN